jgi:hypothetical protein
VKESADSRQAYSAMDVEQLHQVLQQSFSPDAAIRHPAEETIRNLKNLPGSVQLLLQVAAEKQVRSLSSLRQSEFDGKVCDLRAYCVSPVLRV